MIDFGTFEATETERLAVKELTGDKPASVTRADPGETGDLIVTIDDKEYRVNENGDVSEV
jgi:hypothetical protein